MTAVSTNYRKLDPSEVEAVAAECAEAWKNPEIPQRQYDLCVKGELERWRNGEKIAPFEALIRCWNKMPWHPGYHPTVLDVGASSGYYREVLRARDIWTQYLGIDFSEAFLDLQHELWPGLDGSLDLGDARDLPYDADTFDVVLSSACIMHVLEYEKAIRECARVARRFVIFNRTPIHWSDRYSKQTLFYQKEAYGVPCLEIHFDEAELMELFRDCGLHLVHVESIFEDIFHGHRCYLLEKIQVEPYASNPHV